MAQRWSLSAICACNTSAGCLLLFGYSTVRWCACPQRNANVQSFRLGLRHPYVRAPLRGGNCRTREPTPVGKAVAAVMTGMARLSAPVMDWRGQRPCRALRLQLAPDLQSAGDEPAIPSLCNQLRAPGQNRTHRESGHRVGIEAGEARITLNCRSHLNSAAHPAVESVRLHQAMGASRDPKKRKARPPANHSRRSATTSETLPSLKAFVNTSTAGRPQSRPGRGKIAIRRRHD